MHGIDLSILGLYLLALLGVGFYFSRQHVSDDDYFLGGRNIKSWHVGLSVVATDVGGGFSIGLGGLGFMMGVSGSWMLFTGLIGAWLSAVFLIPKVKSLEATKKFSTFNDIISHYYGSKVALLASIISLVGYLGFTSSQFLAGAKLTTATFPSITLDSALLIMGSIAVIYTAFGGLKAVIYTDTVQWIVLMSGLIFVGIPCAYIYVGGWDVIIDTLPAHFFSMTHLNFEQIWTWILTIIPVWFIGLTLYQRIYACSTTESAQKAWYLAGLLEWPIMAFMGSILGLLARVAFERNLFSHLGFDNSVFMDAEMALPILLRESLGVGFLGIVMSAYFSAILSTADSCLMAASGSAVSDFLKKKQSFQRFSSVKLSQVTTFVLGFFALILAYQFTNVLNLMLLSYGVMVSGLFIPIIGGLTGWRIHPLQGGLSILFGGGTTLVLSILNTKLPIAWGLLMSIVGFALGYLVMQMKSADQK